MPALRGGGIHHAPLGRLRSGDPPAPEQPSALVQHRRLSWCDAILGLVEAHPLAVSRCAHGRRERAYLDADLALGLAKPVPVGDAHCFNRERTPWADHDPRLLRLDPDDIQRLLLTADFDSASLADG